ncbi:MAG: hypothetical protein AB7G11_05290 [Phycisphaerales bacterium]
MASFPNEAGRQAGPLRSPMMLDDLLSDLLWPKLLRAPVLALSPSRVILAAFSVLIGALVISLAGSLEAALGWGRSEESVARLSRVTGVLLSLPDWASPRGFGAAWVSAALELPGASVRAHPLISTAGALVMVVLWCIGGGAISRSVVCELGGDARCTWTQALGMSLSRAPSSISAMLFPLVLVALLAVLGALGGLVLLRAPGLNLLGSVLYGGFVLVGFLAVTVLVLYAVGHVMLVPAVMADGSDAIDAIQRAYAYVLGRPARYAVYAVLAIVQGLVVVGIAGALVWGATTFTTHTTGRLAGESGRTAIMQAQAAAQGGDQAERLVLHDAAVRQAIAEAQPLPTERDARPSRLRTFAWGARVIELWILVPMLLLSGFIVSYIHSASSVVYLLMRRLSDGQDIAEIWKPREPGEESAGADRTVSEAVGDAD